MPGGNNQFLFDTNALIQVVPNLKKSQKFLLNRYFPNIRTSDTEFVSIDVDVGKRRMSPFVSPLVEGKLVEQRRYQTNMFKPPYIKDKRAPDLRKPVRRAIGERIGGGELTAAQREMANIQFEMEDQVDMLDRRLEWMAAQALLTGTVTVSGDGFPTSVIDFGRDSSLTSALTGNARWGVSANYDSQGRDPIPTANLETLQYNMLKLSGTAPADLIFTVTPWLKFLNSNLTQGAINYPALNSQYGNALNPGAQIERGAVFKGKWGQYNLFVYNDWYVDDNNVERQMIPDGTVLMVSPDLDGIQAFATIYDPYFNYTSMPYAPKTWVEEDPAQRFLMMQSAPVIIPARPNASMAITVCAPSVF